MIVFDNVTKSYDGDPAVSEINFHIPKGEIAFLTGPSGAGKTTILKLIYGAEKPEHGTVLIGGMDVSGLGNDDIPLLRRSVGVVFQDFKLLRQRTVYHNVELPLRILGMDGAEIRERVHQALRLVGIRHKAEVLPDRLSGGEQQRVVIARAIVGGPTVLLADEPTGNLDADTAGEVMALFREINARGTTILVATHNREIFERSGKAVLRLRKGRLLP